MNFEELLETRDVRKTTKVRLPYGYFYMLDSWEQTHRSSDTGT